VKQHDTLPNHLFRQEFSMPKFGVRVTHEYTKEQILEVEAATEAEAQELANDHPGIDWSEPEHCGYEVAVWPIES